MTRSRVAALAPGASRMTIDTAEAVAIAQQLIASVRNQSDANEVHPPYGPPSAENVFLNDDGSVVCRGCGATPAISEVAIFLDSLLPGAPQRIPGGLRYTIARALLDVEAPPATEMVLEPEPVAETARQPSGQPRCGVAMVHRRPRGGDDHDSLPERD